MISGKTQLVGLIGYPVSHSVSPPMHNAAFAKLGLDWCYVPLPVPVDPPERIGESVAGIRALGMMGANVTVPHKQSVMPHLDHVTQAARAIGAVNTISVGADGALTGDNTDAPGFVRDICDYGVELAGKRVLLLGAGGSARAVAYGLAEAGCVAVTILNRTVDRAARIVDDMQPFFAGCKFAHGAMPDDIGQVAAQSDIIVNSTSLGMSPNVDGLPWDEAIKFRTDQVVYDLIYNPAQTRLLAQAAADGARTINGLGMLVWQGAIAFEIWTGEKAPVDVMKEAIGR